MPVERASGGTSLIDVLDRVLDKGIVIDAWVRVSLVGIDLITVEARVVVASIDTYLKYSEAVGQAPAVAPKAICALIDAESGSLQHVAASGVSEGQLDSLHLALEQADHPLLFALAGRDPVTLGRNGRRNGDPWRDFLAIPLPMSEKREARQGLLL